MHRLFVFIGLCLLAIKAQNLTIEEFEKQNKCKCVLYYLCDDENNINVNGKDLIDIRLGDEVPRKVCPVQDTLPQFCCNLPNARESTVTEPVLIPSTVSPVTDKPIRHTPTVKLTTNVTCGIQRPSFDVRFLSDKFSATISGEFPWMAAIYRKNVFKCTGAVVHPQVIVTVAHYVKRGDRADYKVVVNGETFLGGDTSKHERTVIDVIRHPDFYSGGLFNDIALLILDQPLEISQFGALINEICLPKTTDYFQDKKCIVAGWNNKDTSIPLKKVVVPFVPHDKCQSDIRKFTKRGPNFDLHDSFTCGGGIAGQDACIGDGGSPMMCNYDNVFFLTGLVSWGQGCGQENVPGVYTDVSKFSNWIKEEAAKHNLQINIP